MEKLACHIRYILLLYSTLSYVKLACVTRSSWFMIKVFYYMVYRRVNSFCVRLFYFIFVSFIGFWVLEALVPRSDQTSFHPRKLDLFFTSVSATTVSSMSVIEMEVLSNSQLLVMTVLMFFGGEVFVSMTGLYLRRSSQEDSSEKDSRVSDNGYQLEMIETGSSESVETGEHQLKEKCFRLLGSLVLIYFVVIQAAGVAMVWIYVSVSSTAKNILQRKGLSVATFAIFTIVSTFSSCGYIPTNENMVIFSKNSGLLLILIPQTLLGNTLFPSCLRLLIWLMGKFVKKQESKYLLEHSKEIGYTHLLPGHYSWLLVLTVCGFIGLQFVMICAMEWSSDSLVGLSTSFERVIGVLFQSVNSRHTGETVADISTFSAAILVLIVVMMYLPPYTSFIPVKKADGSGECEKMKKKKQSGRLTAANLVLSQSSFLVIFIILICITERTKMKEDPINFSLLNIVVEVISAYGNVGFTAGYSCARQLTPDPSCVNKWIGFSGKWSVEGKIILIIVMIFGRLKKFTLDGGKAWKLL